MADQPNPYRFTIRDLLLATAGLGVLLFVYRWQGGYFVFSFAATLSALGALFKLLSVRPLQNWKAPLFKCTLFTLGTLFLLGGMGTVVESNGVFSRSPSSLNLPYCPFLGRHRETLLLLVALALQLTLTASTACYGLLLWYSERPWLVPIFLLVSGWLLFMETMFFFSDPSERLVDTFGGYVAGMIVLVVPKVYRWFKL